MRHDDERRASSTILEARRAEFLKDPDDLVTKYVGLLAREELRVARADKYESELRKKDAELRRYRSETARLGSKCARLEAELTDVGQVLYALRRSWRVRIGRWVTGPVRLAYNVMQGLSAKTLRTGPRTGSVQTSTKPMDERSEEEDKYNALKRSIAQKPTSGNVTALIQHCYFTQGKVKEPTQLVETYQHLLDESDPETVKLIGLIQGLNRLHGTMPALPPRQTSPAYVVERGRVMYCAHSTIGYNSNGYSTRTAGICRGLASNDVDLIVVARPGYPWDVQTDRTTPAQRRFEETVHEVPHIYTPGPSWPDEPLDHYLQEATDIYVREAIKSRVSIIHAASNHVTALPALIAARRLGIPFIYEVRGLWEITEASLKNSWDQSERYDLAVQLEKAVANNSDGILAITPQVAEVLVSRGAERERISILPNAVDSDEFSPLGAHTATREKLGIPEDALVVGYAGSLVSYEGLEDLIEAASLVLSRREDIRFVVVGDGSDLNSLRDRATDLGIADAVIFTGRVSPSEVSHYISIFDLMPCPRRSVTITELVPPLKPMEAMASGKAVILSDVAPLRDIAGEDADRAVLFEAGNVEELAHKILELAADQQLRTDLGRRARQWIVKARTWTSVSEKARRTYDGYQVPKTASDGRSRHLHDLTIGIIADEFTLVGLRNEANLVEILPADWQEQLTAKAIDALFVESAWDGVDGSWHHKVGYYDDESFSSLKALTDYCHRNGIPTIFWNKEDPVHFNRFRKTSKHFQHVFTTDSNSIINYLRNAGSNQKTVSSLPFYAQPHLHNPLPAEREYSHTTAYAGSYYGDRYKERSDRLLALLSGAVATGLTIYDRQHLNPESPYRFPADLARYVAGGLTYSEMVDAYKSHPVHINVNSVESSPTMFSRRVVEASASGGAVVSGPGLGVEDVFDGRVAVVSSGKDAQLLIQHWMYHEDVRKRDAWLGMRTIYRAHTAGHRLTYALRTAGLEITAPSLPSYAVLVDDLTDPLVQNLLNQSVPPQRIIYFGGAAHDLPDGVDARPFSAAELRTLEREGIHWVGVLNETPVDRVYFEDMLTTTLYGPWDAIAASDAGLDQAGHALATPIDVPIAHAGMVSLDRLNLDATTLKGVFGADAQKSISSLQLSRTPYREAVTPQYSQYSEPAHQKIVVAGHDLKFATRIIEELEGQGHEVVIDHWANHTQHDERHSLACIEGADVIFCEWALGNAVWYSNNKRPNQRMIVRFHLQELFTPYPHRLRMDAVDNIIFVGAHLRDQAVRDFQLDAAKCLVVPNYVNDDKLNPLTDPTIRFNIGLVGIVPQRKRLDQALDVLARLRAVDDRYRLFIKGKAPKDYSWMAERSEEMEFYEEQYRRIANDPLLVDAVFFDGYSDDMSSWYRKIGVVLSVSDFESFHLTLPDGAASGALPASLAWAGADRIYPQSWISPDVTALSSSILVTCANETTWEKSVQEAQAFAIESFAVTQVLPQIIAMIVPEEFD